MSIFDLTLPGGIPAVDLGEGYAFADPYAEDYDAAQLAFTTARARVMASPDTEILAELPATTLTDLATSRDEMAAMIAINARDRILVNKCLWHQVDGKWSLVFTGKYTRSQMPVLPDEVAVKLRPTAWKVIEASTSPFDL